MSNSIPPTGMGASESLLGATPSRPAGDDARLRQASEDLEGLFVAQLFKAMRKTVPEGGLMDGGAGEDMFRGMMDERLAALVPQQWDDGMGAAIYRQLRGALEGAQAGAAATSGEGDSR